MGAISRQHARLALRRTFPYALGVRVDENLPVLAMHHSHETRQVQSLSRDGFYGSAKIGMRRRIQAMLLVSTSRSPPKIQVGRTIE
jgi:hypothetical protein